MTYVDRCGQAFQPRDGDVIRPREGAFCVFTCKDKVLVTVEDHAPDTPSLPGGGIDPGETALQAARREFHEETGMPCPEIQATQELTQDICLYANDVNEYWDYHQTYFLFPVEENSPVYFEGKRENPCGYFSFWQDLDNLSDSAIHYIHKHAMIKMLGL